MTNHLIDTLVLRGADRASFLRAPDGTAWSYADLRDRIRRVAGALIGFGVQPGDRVAAQIEKSREGLVLYLGTLYAGAAYLPLNPAYTAAEVAYFLADAEPRLVLCDPARRDELAGIAACAVATLDGAGRGELHDAVESARALGRPVPRGADDLAAILYTSGTTGRAKGAMLTHANLVSNAETLAELWRFAADDRLLHVLPIYHTHGLFTATNTVLAAGASLLFLPRFDPEAVIRALPDATAMMGVPTFYTRLLDQPAFSGKVAQHMRVFISGSAPLLASTHRQFAERTGHAILERYGMTETNMNTSNPYDGERRAGTVGFPLPGTTVRVVHQRTGRMVEPGEIGSIEIKGPNVCAGYWRNPEKTHASFTQDGFFITGDLGQFDRDGYLAITGRDKDLIITGGLNVYPKEVELVIDAVPGVLESAVVGLPHSDLGEAVAAAVVAAPGSTLQPADILAAISGDLARFKQPKQVRFVEALPRNAMGKVQKNVLRERLGMP